MSNILKTLTIKNELSAKCTEKPGKKCIKSSKIKFMKLSWWEQYSTTAWAGTNYYYLYNRSLIIYYIIYYYILAH